VIRFRLSVCLFAVSLTLTGQSPDCSVVPGFTQDGKLREFDTETLYEYMNGNSEGYFLYGFAKMRGVSCKQGPNTVIIDLSEFKSPELAYGMFTGNYDNRLPTEKVGAIGQVTPRKAIFVKGSLYAEIAIEPEGEHADLLRKAIQAWDKKLPGSTDSPAALTWFPKEKIQPGFPRLIPQSVLGLRILTSGYLAQYANGKAFLVTEASPAAATALLGKLKERFPPTGTAQVGEEAFLAEDKYLGRICLFRVGARVGGWTNTPLADDPAALARSLAAAIK
jgi:hypothetical protein